MTHEEMIAVITAHKEGKAIVEYDSTDKERTVPKNFISWNFNECCYEILETLPQKFKKGDKVKIEGVVPIGEVKGYKSGFVVVDYGQGEVGYKEEFLQPYISLTREEITAQWVRDNDVKVGDFVKLNNRGGVFNIFEILSDKIIVDLVGYQDRFNVELLKKVTKRIEKFSFEDRELFMGKWVRVKGTIGEGLIVEVLEDGFYAGGHTSGKVSYESGLRMLEFTDGKPFGKEVWE